MTAHEPLPGIPCAFTAQASFSTVTCRASAAFRSSAGVGAAPESDEAGKAVGVDAVVASASSVGAEGRDGSAHPTRRNAASQCFSSITRRILRSASTIANQLRRCADRRDEVRLPAGLVPSHDGGSSLKLTMRRAVVWALLVGCGAAQGARTDVGQSSGVSIVAAPSTGRIEAAAAPQPSDLDACVEPIDPVLFSRPLPPEPPRKQRRGRAQPDRNEPADRCRDMPAVECTYSEAREHFEQSRFDLAAKGFRQIAFGTEVDDVGVFAGELELESLHQIWKHADPPRPTCEAALAAENAALLARYCSPGVAARFVEHCEAFRRIARDVLRLEAERLVARADRGAPDEPAPLYEKAGDIYRALFAEACLPNQKSNGTRCDELLFNAYRAFRAARARVKSEEAYRTFFDSRYGLEQSELGKKLAAEAQ